MDNRAIHSGRADLPTGSRAFGAVISFIMNMLLCQCILPRNP
eukprot:IDg6517t1